MAETDTDRIEKHIVLRTPRSRVWRAIADAGEFGEWFGAKFDGSFVEGTVARGKVTYPGYEHLTMEIHVEHIEPEQLFSYRWHPYAIDTSVDYSSEPMTLVEFWLEEVESGTSLTIIETGFDRIPPERRAKAFEMNEGGWAEQLTNIERHVTQR